MTENKKVFLSVLGMVMAGCVSAANAQQSAQENILFKIHDVQPVKNADGAVVACDFDTTLYNRSNSALRVAVLNLTWTDETVTALVNDEKKAEQKKSGRSYSKTENVTPPSVSTSIDVPQIEPFTQVTVRNRLQSDRCFLLIGDVKSSATNCSVIAAASKERVSPVSTNNKGGNCDGLFKFVSPTDPEYYREFKPVSYEEDKALSENKRAQDRRDINTQYDAVVTEINKVSKVLSEIKGDINAEDLDGENPASGSSEASNEALKSRISTLFPDAAGSASETAGNGASDPSGGMDNPAGAANSAAGAAQAGAGNSGMSGNVGNNGGSAAAGNTSPAQNDAAADASSAGDDASRPSAEKEATPAPTDLLNAVRNAKDGTNVVGADNGLGGYAPAAEGAAVKKDKSKVKYNSPNVG